MKTTCTRRIQFCCGHRVMGHENKCAHLHGHNYVALITARANELDAIGRVIDFSVLKNKIGGWIEENWDHGFVIFQGDTAAREAIRRFQDLMRSPTLGSTWTQKVFVLPSNPTAENMAHYLLHTVCHDLLAGTGVVACKVKLWETENCYAEVRL